STLDFGANPRAALEQQPDDQDCLNRNRSGGDHDHGPVFAPETGALMAHFASRRQPALVDVPALQLASVEYRLTCQLRRDADAACGRSIQDTKGRIRGVDGEVVDGYQVATDYSGPEQWTM